VKGKDEMTPRTLVPDQYGTESGNHDHQGKTVERGGGGGLKKGWGGRGGGGGGGGGWVRRTSSRKAGEVGFEGGIKKTENSKVVVPLRKL